MALWLMNRTTPFGESLLAIVIRAISWAPSMAPPVAPVSCISNISLNSLGGRQEMIKWNMLQVHKTYQQYNIQSVNQYQIRVYIAILTFLCHPLWKHWYSGGFGHAQRWQSHWAGCNLNQVEQSNLWKWTLLWPAHRIQHASVQGWTELLHPPQLRHKNNWRVWQQIYSMYSVCIYMYVFSIIFFYFTFFFLILQYACHCHLFKKNIYI